MFSALDLQFNGSDFFQGNTAAAGHRTELRRSGTTDVLVGVCPKRVSVHHSSKGKHQHAEELTLNPPRYFTWDEREQGACATAAARFGARRDPKTVMEVARARF